jgi:tetratricopeptide (TPR) repeat protein
MQFDAQGLKALEHLVGVLNARAPLPRHAEIVGDLLQGIREDLAGSIPAVHRMTTYLQGLLLAGQGQADAAMPYFIRAFELYGRVDSGLRMVSDLAILGHYEEALELLSLSEALLTRQGSANEPFSERRYRSEIERLRAALRDDLQAQAPPRDQLDAP